MEGRLGDGDHADVFLGRRQPRARERAINRTRWHIIIPFYFGKNEQVTWGGGAPVKKKMAYLSKTLSSFTTRLRDPDITIVVCNEPSAAAASGLAASVKFIDCPPRHLPYRAVRETVRSCSAQWTEDSVVLFNEDDQVLHMSDSVIGDIEARGRDFFFSPHRWARLFLGAGTPGGVRFRLDKKQGVISNLEQGLGATATHCFNRRYRVQTSPLGAYAACWATHLSTLRRVVASQFSLGAELHPDVGLEAASFLVFASAVPVLKLDLAAGEDAGEFLVDHLSGYDYHRRRLSWKRLWSHVRKLGAGRPARAPARS